MSAKVGYTNALHLLVPILSTMIGLYYQSVSANRWYDKYYDSVYSDSSCVFDDSTSIEPSYKTRRQSQFVDLIMIVIAMIDIARKTIGILTDWQSKIDRCT